MQALSEIGITIVGSLGGLYVLIILLRFLLQVARADFYNPISQFIVKATNYPLRHLRKVIPGFRGYDIASLVLALFIEFITIYLCSFFSGLLLNPLAVVLWALLGVTSMAVYVYFVAMIAMIIVSWLAPATAHPVAMLARQLCYPICAPFQRLIPPMGGIDISPIFVFLALNVARIAIQHAAAALQLLPGIVPGIA